MDKPVRKIIRLDNYDYSKKGLYFITICTVHKNELLWATDVGDGAPTSRYVAHTLSERSIFQALVKLSEIISTEQTVSMMTKRYCNMS